MWWEEGQFYVAVVAVVATAVVAIVVYRQIERHRREDRRSDRGTLTTDPLRESAGPGRAFHLRVTNAGTQPLNDVYCAIVGPDGNTVSGQGEYGDYVGPLMPGQSQELDVTIRPESAHLDPLRLLYRFYTVAGEAQTYQSRAEVPWRH